MRTRKIQSSNSNFSQHREPYVPYVPSPPPISYQAIISNQYRSNSKKRYNSIFHPLPSSLPLLFSPRQDKLETRVSTLFPCTGLCVWNNVSTLSRVQELSCKSISEGCFRAGESQLVKRLLLPTPAPSAGTRPASSSSRSCRAFQITGISARVGINIEIFLWATNRRYWKTYPPPPPPFFFLSSAFFHQLSNATFFYFSSLYRWEWLEGLVNSGSVKV